MHSFFSSEDRRASVRPPREELQQVFVGRKTVAERCFHLRNVVKSASGPGQSHSKAVMDFFEAVPRLVGLIFELSTTSVTTRNSWMRGEHKGATRRAIIQILSISTSFSTQSASLAPEQHRSLRGDVQRWASILSTSSSDRDDHSMSDPALAGVCSLPELLRRQSPSPEAQRTWDQALGGIVLSSGDDVAITQFPFPLEYLPAPVRRMLDEKKIEGLSELFATRLEVVVNVGTEEKPSAVRMPLQARFDRAQVLYFELKLNLFEYYLFHFVYFATVERKTEATGGISSSLSQTSSLRNSIGGAVSTPLGRNAVDAITAAENYFTKLTSPSKKGPPVPLVYIVLLRNYLQYFFPNEDLLAQQLAARQLYTSDTDETRKLKERLEYSQTFLQLMIEFWLGENRVVKKESGLTSVLAKEIPMSSLLDGKSPSVKKPLEFRVLPELSYLAIKELVLHLLRDPWLSSQEEGRRSALPSYDRGSPASLTSALIALQKPLYDFLKITFSEWPFNETNTSFLAPVEIWLAYITVWKLPEHVDACPDLAQWRGFVQHNCMLFSSILERFIFAARHFNTVTVDHELEALEKVLDAFSTPGLISILDECEGIVASLSSEFLPMTVPSYGKQEQQVIQEHCMSLGIDVTGIVFLRSEASLASVRKVLSNLVEDMSACRSYMGSSQRESSMRKEERIDIAGDKLARIFGLDWSACKRERAALTSNGNRLGSQGRRPRSRLEVQFIGDPAKRPITSMENSFLVRQLYKLSLYLQRKFDLETPPNLRPLASYQVHVLIVAVAIGVYLLWHFAQLIVIIANHERVPPTAYRRRL